MFRSCWLSSSPLSTRVDTPYPSLITKVSGSVWGVEETSRTTLGLSLAIEALTGEPAPRALIRLATVDASPDDDPVYLCVNWVPLIIKLRYLLSHVLVKIKAPVWSEFEPEASDANFRSSTVIWRLSSSARITATSASPSWMPRSSALNRAPSSPWVSTVFSWSSRNAPSSSVITAMISSSVAVSSQSLLR